MEVVDQAEWFPTHQYGTSRRSYKFSSYVVADVEKAEAQEGA